MSWSMPIRLASLTSALISAAIMPASQATSLECCRQFWPYDDRYGRLDRVVRGQALDRGGENFFGLLSRGLARLLLEAHADELGLALGLLLHLRHELAPRLLGREAGDHLELAALLVERLCQLAFLLPDRLLAVGQALVLRRVLGEAALDVIELAGELLFLAENPLLDLLDLALAATDLVLELTARLEHDLLGFQLGRAVARLGIALGVADDARGARTRCTALAFADELLEDEADEEGDDRDNREQKP